MELNVGEIVLSKAGRDAGRYFLVYNVVDENYVLLVDGNLRKIERPKKKKIKHLVTTNFCKENIAQKIVQGERINNAEIRKAVAGYVETT